MLLIISRKSLLMKGYLKLKQRILPDRFLENSTRGPI